MKVYILGGSVSNVQSAKDKESFKNAEKVIVEMGMTPVNPYNYYLKSKSKEINMLSSIEIMLGCDMVYLLGDWMENKQSRIIKCVADEYNKPIYNESFVMDYSQEIDMVKDAVFHSTGFRYYQYIIQCRKRELHFARLIFIYQIKKLISKEMAQMLINRDYYTVYHAIKVYDNEYETNKHFRLLADKAEKKLQQSVLQ